MPKKKGFMRGQLNHAQHSNTMKSTRIVSSHCLTFSKIITPLRIISTPNFMSFLSPKEKERKKEKKTVFCFLSNLPLSPQSMLFSYKLWWMCHHSNPTTLWLNKAHPINMRTVGTCSLKCHPFKNLGFESFTIVIGPVHIKSESTVSVNF